MKIHLIASIQNSSNNIKPSQASRNQSQPFQAIPNQSQPFQASLNHFQIRLRLPFDYKNPLQGFRHRWELVLTLPPINGWLDYKRINTMLDIEKCIAYFEERDFQRRLYIIRNTSPTFKVQNMPLVRKFLVALAYIEYELVMKLEL